MIQQVAGYAHDNCILAYRLAHEHRCILLEYALFFPMSHSLIPNENGNNMMSIMMIGNEIQFNILHFFLLFYLL